MRSFGMTTWLVTGATGFLGGQIVERIVAEGAAKGGVRLVLPVRNAEKAKERFRETAGNDHVEMSFLQCDLTRLTPEALRGVNGPLYVIHCAAPTDSRYMAEHPVETVDAIVRGTKQVLEVAKACRAQSMVYLSSMEVYGVVTDTSHPRTEEELGGVPLSSARSSYPLGKRLAEHLCGSYHLEYDVPVKIARLAQVFGHGVRRDDSRVFMQFAKAVTEKKNILLQTSGRSFGNYCATEDALDAIFTILEHGDNGACYNVVNESCTMRIADMAAMVCDEIANGEIGVEFAAHPDITYYPPETELRMSSEKLRQLGWKPTQGLREMYRQVLEVLSPDQLS